MNEIIDKLTSMDTETLVILGIAALLLILLLVLIIVTIRVLATAGKDYPDKKSKKKSKKKSDDSDDESDDDSDDEDDSDEDDSDDDDSDEDDEDDYDDEEDETSRKVREAVESVQETKARVDAEKLAKKAESEQQALADAVQQAEKSSDDALREAAAARVEEIANAVQGQTSDNQTDAVTGDTQEIKKPDRKAKGSVSSRFANMQEENRVENRVDNREEEINDSDYVSEDDEDYDSVADGNTDELDTDKIVAALREERSAAQEMSENLTEMAKQRAEAPEYNASFDSAFVERPDNDEKKEPVIPNPTPESVLAGTGPLTSANATTNSTIGPDPNLLAAGAAGTAANPVPAAPVNGPVVQPAVSVPESVADNTEADSEATTEIKTETKADKKKKKLRDRGKTAAPAPSAPVKNAKYFWYNKQDVEGLARKEDMYFKCHYFNDADDVIIDLVTEMYDCGFVRTEELQRIAYGITFKSLGMKEILRSDEDLGFDKDKATKEPTAMDKQEAYEKWCGYVNNFMTIAVINAPDEVKDYITQKMYDYGNRDIEDLMYSPY